MSRRFFKFVSIVVVLVALASQAQAAFIITILQQGSNVVATGSGTINLSALSTHSSDSQEAFVDPIFAAVSVGTFPVNGMKPQYDTGTGHFNGGGGPQNFGTAFGINADSATGDIVQITGQFGSVAVPSGYQSGAPLSGTATWDNTTISGLTLIPGSYTWSWGSLAHGNLDSFTVNIGVQAVQTPEPSSFVLGGLGAVGLLAMARRRRRS